MKKIIIFILFFIFSCNIKAPKHKETMRFNVSTKIIGRCNNIKIIYLNSNKFYWQDRDKEIKKKIKKFLKNKNHKILKINNIYGESWILASEIYYCDEK